MKTTITTMILIKFFNLIVYKSQESSPLVPFEMKKFANLNPDWILHIYDLTYIKSEIFDVEIIF